MREFGRVLVVEPRRLAAKLTANYLSSGEDEKDKISYQIRFESTLNSKTEICFVTEGIFLNMLVRSPMLEDYNTVILDEFHERNLQTDIALASIKKILKKRDDLKLIVMSATLEAAPLLRYLENSEHIKVPGLTYPVETKYLESNQKTSIEDQVKNAINISEKTNYNKGNILVFSTGRDEINRIVSSLKRVFRNFEIYPLLSDTPQKIQKQIFAESKSRKIIVSTNVAETSITVPNLEVVVDLGKAKMSDYAPWSGLPILSTKEIARDSAIQRSGRAGRVKEGLALRLYSESNFNKRSTQTTSEIKRADLSNFILSVLSIFKNDKEKNFEKIIPWFEFPDEKKLAKSYENLQLLKAIDSDNAITAEGLLMASYPMHPRIAKIVIEGKKRDYESEALLCALIINEGFLLGASFKAPDKSQCDVSYQAQLFITKEQVGEFEYSSLDNSYNTKTHEYIKKIYSSIAKEHNLKAISEIKELDPKIIRECIFYGFSDRVAKYRTNAKKSKNSNLRNFHFATGRGGILSESSTVVKEDYIIVLEALENPDMRNSATRTQLRRASSISQDFLEEIKHPLKSSTVELEINEKKKNYKIIKKEFYGNFVFLEKELEISSDSSPDIISDIMQTNWPFPFSESTDLDQYHRKIELLNEAKIENDLPIFKGEMFELFIESIVDEYKNLEKIKSKKLSNLIYDQLSYEQQSMLEMYFPEKIKLSNGKSIKIDYFSEEKFLLVVESKNFFGVSEHPMILGKKVLIKLLAPNMRPAQLTTDISGFFKGSYSEVRKELKRRYPKHDWPESP